MFGQPLKKDTHSQTAIRLTVHRINILPTCFFSADREYRRDTKVAFAAPACKLIKPTPYASHHRATDRASPTNCMRPGTRPSPHQRTQRTQQARSRNVSASALSWPAQVGHPMAPLYATAQHHRHERRSHLGQPAEGGAQHAPNSQQR